MQRAAWIASILAVITLTPLAALEPTTEERVARLIEQLTKPDPKARAAARTALESFGPDALPALRKALAHRDIEVRKRVGEIVPALETAVLVAPKLVSLKVQKQTTRQLLDELARQTGYKLESWNDDPQQVFALDLDRVPFWKAIDEIGRLSGLSLQTAYPDDRLRFQKEKGYPEHVCHDGSFRFVPLDFQHHRSLTFRRTGNPGKPAERAETLSLSYTLHAEPKLPLLSAGEAVIFEAVDNEGRSLLPLPPPPAEDDAQRMAVRRAAPRYGNGYATTSVQGSITLGRPADRARGVKLLRAAIPVTLLTEQKPEVVTDKVLDAKNKKVTLGTTTFHIEACELTPEKQYRLKMSVTEEKLEENDYTWMNTLYRRVEMMDEKGNKLPINGSSWSHNSPSHAQVTFNYTAGAAGTPRKLTYQVWKTLSYQVRVELRDLPLP